MSEAKSWSNTPSVSVADSGQTCHQAVFAPGKRGRLPVRGGIEDRLAHWLLGKQA